MTTSADDSCIIRLADDDDDEAEPAQPLAGPRPDVVDDRELAVARSRIANKLFATREQVKLGRYHLLEIVGAGGMGVVWGAWDPELERRVAIKLVKATLRARRERMLREGQALAKLSHPNVVPVYDVGVVDDEVYLVMEWVRGKSLRAYAAERHTVRELVALYRAAGEGLAAAHEVGLVHRDFKPDNAIVGDDGRVRVLDFGLARGEARGSDDAGASGERGAELSTNAATVDATAGGAGAAATRGAGTPRYMAPEQASGAELTPAADQYAFCVSLREAIEASDAPMPRWIADIVAVGTAAAPAQRYPAMRDLVDALAHDPARTWRRRALVGAAAIAVGAAFVVGNLRGSAGEVDPCSGADADIATTWNDGARFALLAHLRSLGAYASEEAPKLYDEMAAYGTRWASAQRLACLANLRGALTPDLYERDVACLTRARVAYATVVDVLAKTPATRVGNAVLAARSLPAVEECQLDAASSTVAAPPLAIAAEASVIASDVERARVLAQADDPQGLVLARSAAERADKLKHVPLVARAQLVLGTALLGSENMAAAVPVLDRAATTGLDAQDDRTFVEAYAREIYALVRSGQAKTAPALGATSYVEHVAVRLGPAGGFARALLFNNIGGSRMFLGDRAGARKYFDMSLTDPDARRDRDVELVSALANRSLVTDDLAERTKLAASAGDAFGALLGAHHHMTLNARMFVGIVQPDPRVAAEKLAEPCRQLRYYHATIASTLNDECAFELGWLAEERGDAAAAREAFGWIARKDSAFRVIGDAYVLLLDGKLEAAAEVTRTLPRSPFRAGDAYLVATLAFDRLGRRTDALTTARQALAEYEKLSFLDTSDYRRRVARIRALLAHLAPPSEGAAFARDALAFYRGIAGYAAVVPELERIRAGSR